MNPTWFRNIYFDSAHTLRATEFAGFLRKHHISYEPWEYEDGIFISLEATAAQITLINLYLAT